MRDPKRINRVIEALRATWHANPHLRLGQLIVNVCGKDCVFYLEDDLLVDELQEYMERVD